MSRVLGAIGCLYKGFVPRPEKNVQIPPRRSESEDQRMGASILCSQRSLRVRLLLRKFRYDAHDHKDPVTYLKCILDAMC
jgi:hypothetical protein